VRAAPAAKDVAADTSYADEYTLLLLNVAPVVKRDTVIQYSALPRDGPERLVNVTVPNPPEEGSVKNFVGSLRHWRATYLLFNPHKSAEIGLQADWNCDKLVETEVVNDSELPSVDVR